MSAGEAIPTDPAGEPLWSLTPAEPYTRVWCSKCGADLQPDPMPLRRARAVAEAHYIGIHGIDPNEHAGGRS